MPIERRGLRQRTAEASERHPAMRATLTSLADLPADDLPRITEPVLDVLEHASSIDASAHADLWSALLAAAQAPENREDPLRCALLVNALGLITLGRPADFRTLLSLITQAGPEVVTALHDQIDAFAGAAARRPWTTELIRRLHAPLAVRLAIETHTGDEPLTTQELEACARAAVELLVYGVDDLSDQPVDPILTAGGFARTVEHEDATVWRRHLASLADDPWSANANRLAALAQAPEAPASGRILADGLRRIRDATEATERCMVAERIRELVQLSGLPQQVFARRVGTSPSRFSTYVHGRTTPSATMLLRMARLVTRLNTSEAAPSAVPGVGASIAPSTPGDRAT